MDDTNASETKELTAMDCYQKAADALEGDHPHKTDISSTWRQLGDSIDSMNRR